ncbi:FAH family protein [Paenibacillus sp. oral taxon 786 str. D14]|uniref:fumarylacetoacetate hydrolase family protein n=1 Tax=Paenibacillus sp. oral taxon 786 TaxID=652715 RepID=UPI0001AFDCF8|nr:fumarylacetoacetate hydrolase family protein [Paenibacillus sp. oral taxon 786]EES72360.1 FAH family protein [Paenibacillus sp. oral taxon 786 str. D14]
MRIVQFQHLGVKKCGIVEENGILPLSARLDQMISGEVDLAKEREKNKGQWIDENEITYEPCVPAGKKIICVGLNYKKHAEEAKMPVPAYPVLFNKYSNGLSGHLAEIPLPGCAEKFDYEAELGVVIGKKAKDVREEEALSIVFGYCNVNDLSARDLQMRTGQWMLGKVLDGFCPVGPYLVTADEVGDPNQLEISLKLNGEIRQSSNTKDMIFSVPELISYISRYMTLEPGDLILTGTPEGVIAGYPEERQVWLKPNDEVTVEIEKLGVLKNVMKGE